MEILLDILKESKAHYLDVQASIQKRLGVIPCGSVFKRRLRSGKYYYYLNFRQGARVVSKYLGKDEPVQLLKRIEERRLLLKRLKDVRRSIAILQHFNREKPRATRHR